MVGVSSFAMTALLLSELLPYFDTLPAAAFTCGYPTDPYVQSSNAAGQFGAPRSGYTHAGIDVWHTRDVEPVYSIAPGTVTHAGWESGTAYGNVVKVSHPDGAWSRYAHLESVAVSVGQTITQGHRVGVMGSTGGDYEKHLHYEVRINGNDLINPRDYIEQRCGVDTGGTTLSAAEVTEIKNHINAKFDEYDPRPRLYKHSTTKQEMAVSVPQRYVRVMSNIADRDNLIALGIISPAAPIVVNDGTYRGLVTEASKPVPTA